MVSQPQQPQGLPVSSLAQVQVGPPRYVWPQYILRGKVTVLSGEPGAGKTLVLISLACALASGCVLPDGTRSPVLKVLYLDLENGPEEFRRRMEAQGFSPSPNLLWLQSGTSHGRLVPFRLECHRAQLEHTLATEHPDLLVIDPLVATHAVEENRATAVRHLMQELAEIATTYDLGLIAVQHPTKATSGDLLRRIRGSGDFVAAARAVFSVVRTETEGVSALVALKMSVGANPPALGFTIDDGRVVWTGEVDVPSSPTAKLSLAKDMLTEMLGRDSIPVTSLHQAARDAGIGWRTMESAKAQLGVKAYKLGASGPWVWSLPRPEDAWDVAPPRQGRNTTSQAEAKTASAAAPGADVGRV